MDKQFTQLRNSHAVLAHWELAFMLADDDNMTLAYRRYNDQNEILVAFNRGQNETTIELPITEAAQYEELLSTNTTNIKQTEDALMITLPSLSGIVLQRQ